MHGRVTENFFCRYNEDPHPHIKIKIPLHPNRDTLLGNYASVDNANVATNFSTLQQDFAAPCHWNHIMSKIQIANRL
jgi:hypothetical protein